MCGRRNKSFLKCDKKLRRADQSRLTQQTPAAALFHSLPPPFLLITADRGSESYAGLIGCRARIFSCLVSLCKARFFIFSCVVFLGFAKQMYRCHVKKGEDCSAVLSYLSLYLCCTLTSSKEDICEVTFNPYLSIL